MKMLEKRVSYSGKTRSTGEMVSRLQSPICSVSRKRASSRIWVSGANTQDTKLLSDTLEAVVVDRPWPTEDKPRHLSLGKGYDNPTGHQAVADRQYTAHIRSPRGRKWLAT